MSKPIMIHFQEKGKKYSFPGDVVVSFLNRQDIRKRGKEPKQKYNIMCLCYLSLASGMSIHCQVFCQCCVSSP